MTKRILFAAVALVLSLSATARANTADPDPTFNGSGLLRLDHGGLNNETGVAVQPDGKIVVIGEGTNDAVARIHRLNADGSPDLAFGGQGLVTIDGPGTDELFAVLVEPNGKILAGGVANHAAVLYRFTAAGALDQSFGVGGHVTLTPADSQASETVFGLAERDDKIVAVGDTVAATTKAAVWKRNAADGSADGQRALTFGDADLAADVAIQPDGRIVVVGTTNQGNNGFVTRLNTNMVPDATFHGGTVMLDAGAAETAVSVALRSDGRIVVVGRASVLTRVMITQLTPAGDLDPLFNGGASQFLDTGLADFPARVLLQPDGKIVIVGSTDLNADISFFRVDAIGQPDETFSGGLQTVDAGGSDTASDAALQPDGDIVAVGAATGDGIVTRILGDPLPLTVAQAGTGRGTVTSNPAGLNCGVKCTATFDVGTKVTLTATANPGSRFTGWTGCASTTATCTVTLHEATTVAPTFTADAVTQNPGNPGHPGGGTTTTHPGTPGPTQTTPPPPPGDRTAPRITRLKLSHRGKHRATLRLTLSEAAATTIAVKRGSRTVTTLHMRLIAGTDTVLFTLPRSGRCSLVLTAADAAGNRSAPATLRFSVRR